MRKRLGLLSCAFIFFSLAGLASACGGSDEENRFSVKSELVALIGGNIDALAFAPDGRLFLADHWGGTVRVVTAQGELLPDPVIQLEVEPGLEWGLTGLAVDPDFERNHYIYAYLTEQVDATGPVAKPVVVRFTEADNVGSDPKVIVGDLPDTRDKQTFNANGAIQFGPDGFLYLTLGDYDVPRTPGPLGENLPQDLGTPMGKMLRVDKKDGSAPTDNPFVDEPGADSRVFAYGFRENFDFEFHPDTGQIFGTDNTSVTCSELNVIESGANYGWPEAGEWPYFDCFAAGKTPAIHFFAREGLQPGDFTSVVSIGGMAFVSGELYPLLGDNLLICAGQNILRVVVSENSDQVASEDLVVEDCRRDIAVSPDGIVYYSTETELRRLVPIPIETED